MLESVGQGTAQARFDLLFRASSQELVLSPELQLSLAGERLTGGFLDAFSSWFARQCDTQPRHPELPFVGGWFVYLGYELAGEIEPRLRLPAHESDFPIAFARYCPGAIILDHALREAWVVSESSRDAEHMVEMASSTSKLTWERPAASFAEDGDSHFLSGVERIKDYILDGDVFQVNLSRGWRGQTKATPAQVYAALRASNPGPFAGLVTRGDSAVVSSSPERLVRSHAGWVDTRPIAGTRPRGLTQAADAALSTELLAHPKERAEHIMLIDLERNDLGRICKAGTVEVNELMVLETYAHVHHIVSNVRGRLLDGVQPGSIVRAVFPGGTITGCPKVRCMEIIAELEGIGRGPYTGAFGYLSKTGDMDLNILIRTLEMQRGNITFRAGAGIVADSQPQHELAECRSKAQGILRAFDQPAA